MMDSRKSKKPEKKQVKIYDDVKDMKISNFVIETNPNNKFTRPYVESSDDDYEYFFNKDYF